MSTLSARVTFGNAICKACVVTQHAKPKMQCTSSIHAVPLQCLNQIVRETSAGPSAKRQKMAGPVARSIGECVAEGVDLSFYHYFVFLL